MLCTGGKDPIDESEIDQFLADIGFEADKFVNINDFAQFLLEWIKTFNEFKKLYFVFNKFKRATSMLKTWYVGDQLILKKMLS